MTGLGGHGEKWRTNKLVDEPFGQSAGELVNEPVDESVDELVGEPVMMNWSENKLSMVNMIWWTMYGGHRMVNTASTYSKGSIDPRATLLRLVTRALWAGNIPA